MIAGMEKVSISAEEAKEPTQPEMKRPMVDDSEDRPPHKIQATQPFTVYTVRFVWISRKTQFNWVSKGGRSY